MITEQARQRLKQEQAAFEQRLRQDAQWFNVRRAAGYGAVIGLLVILGGSMYILLSGQYSAKVTGAAGTAIFVDILGLFVVPARSMRARLSEDVSRSPREIAE